MIKDTDGNRQTAKQKAKALLLDALAVKVDYWTEDWAACADDMTDREQEAVSVQLAKLERRLAKILA
jgi:hypothetical protein